MVRTKFKEKKRKKSKKNIEKYTCGYCDFKFNADNGHIAPDGKESKNMIQCPQCYNFLKNKA